MKFVKKRLLSLSVGGLTFMSSFGAPSCQAMNDTCSVLDYLIKGSEAVSEASPSYVYLLVFSSKPVWIVLQAVAGGLLGGAYGIFKNYKSKQDYMKFLKDNSCGEITEPVCIQLQEGPYWCWIATIQGVLKKLKSGSELSQEEIYELTHNGKKPAYFECFRNNIDLNQPEEECDTLQLRVDKDYVRVLAKISDKLNTGENDLYPFYVLDMTEGYTGEDYRNIMKLLIDTFGSCFGIVDPVIANVTKMPHMVLLSDYDTTTEVLTFEEPSYVVRYQMTLDKFAELCKSGKFKGELDGVNAEIPFFLAEIGFTNDRDKSGCYNICFDQGGLKLVKKK